MLEWVESLTAEEPVPARSQLGVCAGSVDLSANGAASFGDSRKLTRTSTTREHRLPSPQRGRGAGGEGDRGAVSVSSDEKLITSVILTITATLVWLRIAKMGDVGETVHG